MTETKVNSQSHHRLSMESFVGSLPEPEAVTRVDLSESGACYVTVLGFEKRCIAASQYLAGRNWTSALTACVHYKQPDMRELNRRYEEEMHTCLGRISGHEDSVTLEYDDRDVSQDFGEVLTKKLSCQGVDLQSPLSRVFFDITVGSSRILLESLHALLKTNVNLTLLYSESENYRPTFSEYVETVDNDGQMGNVPVEFLTHGVEKVEMIRAIPGRNADSRPVYLAIFPSFNVTRVVAVLQEISPSRVHWLFGVPHLVKNRWRLDAQRAYHRFIIERSHRSCYISTFDYRETLTVLDAIYRKRRTNYDMMVCCLGSKLQKVGQALFHILRPEVGAVASIPQRWNTDSYSDDVPRQIYGIPLGPCGELRQRLSATRMLRP